jgi:hypothetical protein
MSQAYIVPSLFQFVHLDGSAHCDVNHGFVGESVDYVAGDSSGLLAEVV